MTYVAAFLLIVLAGFVYSRIKRARAVSDEMILLTSKQLVRIASYREGVGFKNDLYRDVARFTIDPNNRLMWLLFDDSTIRGLNMDDFIEIQITPESE